MLDDDHDIPAGGAGPFTDVTQPVLQTADEHVFASHVPGASGELLVRSYVVTHGVDAVVTRGSNTYGPYHHPEKLIPLFVTNAIDDRPLPLYGDGLQRRDWLYVADHAGAVEHVLRHGVPGEVYNVAGGTELPNREVVRLLLERQHVAHDRVDEPALRAQELLGGAVYFDAATDDARLTLANVVGAGEAGAAVLNYAGYRAWVFK